LVISDTRQRLAGLSEEQRHALAQRLAKRRRAEPASTIPRRAVEGPIALSFAQQRFWFVAQLGAVNTAYNVGEGFFLSGPLDLNALVRALNEMPRRHSVLRTTFEVVDGRPFQRIAPELALDVRVEDVPAGPDQMQDLTRRAREEERRPWDLAAGPLFRARVFRLSETQHFLHILVHHIISDGWSKGVLVRELTALYGAFSKGQASPLEEPPIQYSDYALWQHEWLASDAAKKQLAYWTDRMAGAPTLTLPAGEAPAGTGAGTHRWMTISSETTAALRALSQAEGVTLFMSLVAAFSCLLSRYSGQAEVVVGSPIANRNRTELENLIGCFMNPLPHRIDTGGGITFRQLLARARETCVGAQANQELPFDVLVRAVHPRRDVGNAPLFQAMILLHNTWETMALSSDGLGSAKFDGTGAAEIDDLAMRGDLVYPIALEVIEAGPRLLACFEYSNEYDTLLRRVSHHFRAVLREVVANPDVPVADLAVVTPDERSTLLQAWAASAPRVEADAAHVQFERQVLQSPDAPAVIAATGTMSYADLNARANRLARHVRAVGAGTDTPVAILLERSPDLITSVYATLKAGAAYVPLDAASPASRLSAILHDARMPVLITTQALLDTMPELAAAVSVVVLLDAHAGVIADQPAHNLDLPVHPAQLAYVIYTSGSTGRPKGVQIPHGALASYAASCVRRFDLTPADRVLQFASIAFDTAVEEIYPALASGAALVLRDDAMLASAVTFLDGCLRHGITVLDLPTAFWHELTARVTADRLPIPPALRLVIIGGEKALAPRAAEWLAAAPAVRLLNTYGPTEATVVATETEIRAGESFDDVRIGTPVPGASAYVLDPAMRLLPAGVVGELYLGGSGLARGYLADPSLTADRFVPNPFSIEPGARLYRTGDLVRFDADGRLLFVGRADRQVKLRGFRIEPSEIEAALVAHADVRDAAVIVREDTPGDQRLVAYVVCAPGTAPAALRRFLQDRLPDHMIPSAYVPLDELPRNTQGKIDRAALPRPSGERQVEEAYVAPLAGTEQAIAAIWAEVLGVDRVGATDNFFDQGGHSLLLLRVHARLQKELGGTLTVVDLFRYPTVRALAERIGGPAAPAAGDASVQRAKDRAAQQREALQRRAVAGRVR
jgi:amino acid adenylation domain-containing protein